MAPDALKMLYLRIVTITTTSKNVPCVKRRGRRGLQAFIKTY